MTQTVAIEQLSTLFEREFSTITDATYIDALRERWKEPVAQAGFLPLAGIVNVSELPHDYVIHPLEYWRVERISQQDMKRFAVPPAACEKLNRAYALDVPVKWLLWAEQYVTPPKVEYRQKTIYVERRSYDPALIALLKGGDDIGIPYVVHCWLHT